ncbi:hypothetical protein WR25_20221 [Diploscapter pachys]|uniref:Uncharacterized protein n=1 Tax=Diploscapter pachys TaxID=2018661 RepID=A0A2A2LQY4_9BILA|nr:hypothetical protein WR25_20221 [Diploscapter pachys]
MDDVERELQACLLAVEKDIAKEKLRKTDNINTLNQMAAHITELTDEVEKMRLQLELAAGRVQMWVEYLKQEKDKISSQANCNHKSSILFAQVCEDLERNMQQLTERKQKLQEKLNEITFRRTRENDELNNLRKEIYELKKELEMLDARNEQTMKGCGKLRKTVQAKQDLLLNQQRSLTELKTECAILNETGYTSCDDTRTASRSGSQHSFSLDSSLIPVPASTPNHRR